eukprot:m.3060 g.3060  ORF g.3060 m.3060 type:complete len:316 (+) comp2656_c0_seq1:98-1045(+)
MDLQKIEADFASNGYVVCRGLFSPEKVSKIRQIYDELWQKAEDLLISKEQEISTLIKKIVDDKGPGRHYKEYGHVAVVWSEAGARYTYGLKPDGDIEAAAKKPSLKDLSVCHVAGVGREFPYLEEVGGGTTTDPVMDLAATLLGKKFLKESYMVQIIQQSHFKSPGSGVSFPWHQDSRFRREAEGDFVDVTGRGSYCNIAIALDPEQGGSTDETNNGPLGVIPGSHKEGHIGGTKYLDPSTVDESKAEYPLLQPGDALCIGPWIVHGSSPNPSKALWRRSFILGFAVPESLQKGPNKDTPSMSIQWNRSVSEFLS